MTENFTAAPSVVELVSGLCTCVYRFQKTQLQGQKGEAFVRLILRSFHGRKRGRDQGQKRLWIARRKNSRMLLQRALQFELSAML